MAKRAKSGKDGDADGPLQLSDFPDEILHHIMTFLPVNYAVRTGSLSKRWQHLWLSVPIIELCERDFSKRATFMSFVERALLLGGSFSLKRFILSCDVDHDATRINSWITAIMRRNVQELSLELDFVPQHGALPSCMFKCESLMHLTLDMAHDLILPSSVCLPSLKGLTLAYVRFVDSASVQNLFSSPALETIHIDGCHWVDLNDVTVSAPNLQKVTVDDFYSDDEQYGQCQVVFNGRNVKLFSYKGNLMYGYSVMGTSSFDKACISVSQGLQGVSAAMYASTLLEGLYNVRSLTLSCRLLESVSAEEDPFVDLPVFCNMTELKLDMKHVIELDFKLLIQLLRKCVCLAKLELEGVFRLKDCDLCRVLEPVPPCFQSHLKKIVVRHFSPTEVNLDCVALLLRKAVVLEKMVLQYEEKVKGSYKVAHLKELPRGSKNCKISLIV